MDDSRDDLNMRHYQSRTTGLKPEASAIVNQGVSAMRGYTVYDNKFGDIASNADTIKFKHVGSSVPVTEFQKINSK